MKKIIKEGFKPPKEFECGVCGCKWITDEWSTYDLANLWRVETMKYADCPTCKYTDYKK